MSEEERERNVMRQNSSVDAVVTVVARQTG